MNGNDESGIEDKQRRQRAVPRGAAAAARNQQKMLQAATGGGVPMPRIAEMPAKAQTLQQLKYFTPRNAVAPAGRYD